MTFDQLRSREDAFSLIEILVVLLIIGILAAIVLPNLLGTSEKAQDTEAKSLARTLQGHAYECYVERGDWDKCNSAAEVPNTGLTWGDGSEPGEVQVALRPFGQDFVAFTVTSKTRTLFAVIRGLSDGKLQRVCFVPSNAYPTGSCRRGGAFSNLGFGTW